ncbi:MAG TPA: acetate kinase [Ruminococcaceae bacterium]|nr:acetate kinase [Oscillospiraceae bacterium]
MKILVINCGSSSLKYQLMDMSDLSVLCKGVIERIGMTINGGEKNVSVKVNGQKFEYDKELPTHTDAFNEVKYILCESEHKVIDSMKEIDAVGHRIVQGGDIYTHSVLVDETVVENLRKLSPLAPLHNPGHIQGYEACKAVVGPDVPQVVVFDTAFHSTMPPKAYMYAVPYEWYEKYGVRRYGFHGTSHRFVSKRCIELMGAEKASRVIVCHLGNGSSLSAVKDGKCQDTSMGLSPLAGVPMGTRAGDIDTCVAQYMMNHDKLTADECLNILNKKSGVLALSGISSDFRDIETAANQGNEDCRLALDKFAYEVKKYIGSYTTVLGGLDCLVFTAGVGENSATMRASICEGLEYLGIKLDPEKNNTRGEEAIISAADSKVTVWVIPTNEELMIAQDTAELCK